MVQLDLYGELTLSGLALGDLLSRALLTTTAVVHG